MAKYIIDIEDEYTKDWINDTPMCKELCMPISVPNRQRTYHVSTGFKLEPYTEPDRKAIEDEVWEFGMNTDWSWISEIDTKPLREYSYQEAKEKYEAWKKQKDEIRVGDEVKWIYNTGKLYKGIVLDAVADEYNNWAVFTENGCIEMFEEDDLIKTGRHSDIVEEMLKKMKEQ